jgi:Domain of unknown function (DUF4262)
VPEPPAPPAPQPEPTPRAEPVVPPAPAPQSERLFRVFTAHEQRPPFSFSLGLAPAGLPELIVFGLREPIAQSLLNQVARDLVGGKQFEAGLRYEDYLVGYPVSFRNVSSSGDYAQYAYIGAAAARVPLPALGTFAVLQIIWSDHSRRFPGEPGYDGESQPLL